MFIFEEGWGKCAVLPMIYMFWISPFANYAFKGNIPRQDAPMKPVEIWGSLLLGLVLVLVAYLGNHWFGKWVGIGIVALFFFGVHFDFSYGSPAQGAVDS
jgi:hypothetical protein